MRIDELNIPSTAPDLEAMLLNKGWQKVGAGYYAEVYSKPDINYVVKVFEKDDGYMEYLRLITAHPNPHFPRVGKNMLLRDHNVRYNGVRLEKLTPCRGVMVGGEMSENLSGMLNAYLLAKFGRLNELQEANLEQAKVYLADKPEFVQALDLIAETKRQHGLFFDVSPYNIMFRGDTPVIIDPYYS